MITHIIEIIVVFALSYASVWAFHKHIIKWWLRKKELTKDTNYKPEPVSAEDAEQIIRMTEAERKLNHLYPTYVGIEFRLNKTLALFRTEIVPNGKPDFLVPFARDLEESLKMLNTLEKHVIEHDCVHMIRDNLNMIRDIVSLDQGSYLDRENISLKEFAWKVKSIGPIIDNTFSLLENIDGKKKTKRNHKKSH